MVDDRRPHLSAVVPVYRNSDTVEALTHQVFEVARDLGIGCEIVFVNDASPDASLVALTALAAIHPAVVVVDLPQNVGQHAAVLHGLARARGETCAILDADLQDRPSSIATLWRARSPEGGVVFGGRTGRYEGTGRHLTSRIFKAVLHALAGVPRDAGIFMLLERDVVDALVRFPTRMPWIQSMIGLLGVPMRSVPITRDRRTAGQSSYSAVGRMKTAARGIWCVLEYRVWRASEPYLARQARIIQRGTLRPNRATKSR
jgi:glycosyltransferase involved in cell wall biosynthesis